LMIRSHMCDAQAPKMFEKIPPAPPGLVWWKYLSDVPPLPNPEEYFESEKYERYGWRYDDSFQVNDYSFSNLDLLSMSNISRGDPRLWVHLISVWVISWWTWRVSLSFLSVLKPLFSSLSVLIIYNFNNYNNNYYIWLWAWRTSPSHLMRESGREGGRERKRGGQGRRQVLVCARGERGVDVQ
jgi:hypothetical protein